MVNHNKKPLIANNYPDKDTTLAEEAQDSSTKVNQPMDFSHAQVNSGTTIRLDGKRRTVGFKCVGELWDMFVELSKERYGSVCHVLEPIILALVMNEISVRDEERVLHIETLNVERAVKRVRRYVVEEKPVSNVAMSERCALCSGAGYVLAFREDKSEVCLCQIHFKKERQTLKGYRYFKQ